MDKDQAIAGWKRNYAVLQVTLGTVNHFATEILRVARDAGAISDAEISAFKESVIFNMKNTGVEGIALEAETEFLWQCVQRTTFDLDTIIGESRQAK